MVSTRGHNTKYKFCDGEKVLCYEPDPTKAKVLYDSKVSACGEGDRLIAMLMILLAISFQCEGAGSFRGKGQAGPTHRRVFDTLPGLELVLGSEG